MCLRRGGLELSAKAKAKAKAKAGAGDVERAPAQLSSRGVKPRQCWLSLVL